MVLVCPYPKEQKIEYFEELVSYGIYKSDTFPYGLIIWKFGNNWLIETPFNILKDDDVSGFLSEDSNALTRVLIDEKGIVRSLKKAKGSSPSMTTYPFNNTNLSLFAKLLFLQSPLI